MYEDLGRVWNSSKKLFSHKKVDETVREELKNSNLKLGIWVFALSAVLISGILLFSSIMGIYLQQETFETIAELSEEVGQQTIYPEVTDDMIIGLALFQLVLLPVMFIILLGYEVVVYKILRISGGKGSFDRHIYIASIVTMAIVISHLLTFFQALPCLNIIALIGGMALFMYLNFFVRIRAYSIVHDISFAHAFAVAVVFIVIKLILDYIVGFLAYNMIGMESVLGV